MYDFLDPLYYLRKPELDPQGGGEINFYDPMIQGAMERIRSARKLQDESYPVRAPEPVSYPRRPTPTSKYAAVKPWKKGLITGLDALGAISSIMDRRRARKKDEIPPPLYNPMGVQRLAGLRAGDEAAMEEARIYNEKIAQDEAEARTRQAETEASRRAQWGYSTFPAFLDALEPPKPPTPQRPEAPAASVQEYDKLLDMLDKGFITREDLRYNIAGRPPAPRAERTTDDSEIFNDIVTKLMQGTLFNEGLPYEQAAQIAQQRVDDLRRMRSGERIGGAGAPEPGRSDLTEWEMVPKAEQARALQQARALLERSKSGRTKLTEAEIRQAFQEEFGVDPLALLQASGAY